MNFREKVETIKRVVTAIKVFRQHTGYTGRVFESTALNTYLENTLLSADLKLWTALCLTAIAQHSKVEDNQHELTPL